MKNNIEIEALQNGFVFRANLFNTDSKGMQEIAIFIPDRKILVEMITKLLMETTTEKDDKQTIIPFANA